MAENVYKFTTPTYTESAGSDPLMARVKNTVGKALIQHPDGAWEEFSSLPTIFGAGADYLFGRTDRSSRPKGRGFATTADEEGTPLVTPADMGWRSPLRIYRGGRIYFVDDALAEELIDAGYESQLSNIGGAYSDVYGDIYFGDEGSTGTFRIGDEIMLSGRTPEFEQPTYRTAVVE